MKPNIIDVLLIAVIEAALTKLEQDNAKLREQAAGYDRLKAENQRLKGREASLESRIASTDESARSYWTMYQNSESEVRQLKQQVLELGRKNIALAAEAESVQQLEQQLATADQRIRELESALAVASLPAASRANVISLIQEQAA